MPNGNPSLDTLIADYFECWKTHDVDALARIFATDATYAILPRARTLSGLEAIRAYWQRNQARQRDVAIVWAIIERHDSGALVAFRAQYFDVEVGQHEQVTGTMDIQVEHRAIHALIEWYERVRLLTAPSAPPMLPPNPPYAPRAGSPDSSLLPIR